jgi:hypothetical protein
MGWYTVIKTIRGVRYRYKQRAWREGKRVRTQCICLGRLSGEEGRGTIAGANTTANTPSEPWRAELKAGLGEVVRRLEGNHFVVEQIETIDVAHGSRAALLKRLRALQKNWEGSQYAFDHLGQVTATLAAFGNTTPPARAAWRTKVVEQLAISMTWMPTKELRRDVEMIIAGTEIAEPEKMIAWLDRLDGVLDGHPERRRLKSIIADIRNTTGTHTDASLVEMLFTAEPTGRWQRPWRTEAATGTLAPAVDRRVIAAPVKLGVTVKSQSFAADGDIARVAIRNGEIDGAWYQRSLDTIQIPDATRYIRDMDGVAGSEAYEHSLLHETCHAAWHRSRLNREWRHDVRGRFGKAANEVVTDTAACLVERRLGLKRPALWGNRSDYVQSWLKRTGLSAERVSELQAEAVIVADYVVKRIVADGKICRGCGGAVSDGNMCRDCIPFRRINSHSIP